MRIGQYGCGYSLGAGCGVPTGTLTVLMILSYWTRVYWPALRAKSMAYWLKKRPAPGSPRPHDPSDSPGRLIHR